MASVLKSIVFHILIDAFGCVRQEGISGLCFNILTRNGQFPFSFNDGAILCFFPSLVQDHNSFFLAFSFGPVSLSRKKTSLFLLNIFDISFILDTKNLQRIIIINLYQKVRNIIEVAGILSKQSKILVPLFSAILIHLQ